jgi:hypothetical protein
LVISTSQSHAWRFVCWNYELNQSHTPHALAPGCDLWPVYITSRVLRETCNGVLGLNYRVGETLDAATSSLLYPQIWSKMDLWNQALGRSVKGPWASYKPESVKFCPLPGSTLVRFSVFFGAKFRCFSTQNEDWRIPQSQFFLVLPHFAKGLLGFFRVMMMKTTRRHVSSPYRPWETDW